MNSASSSFDLKDRRVIIFIVVEAAIIFLLGGYGYFKNDKLGNISIGMAAGLFTWTFTFIITKSIDKSFERHDQKTTTILDVVQGKYITLINQKRKEIGPSLYQNHYKGSSKIRISGRAMEGLRDELFSAEPEEAQLFNLMRQDDMTVNVLFMHPSSEIVKLMDKASEHQGNFNSIMETIKWFKNFENRNDKFRNNSVFEVKATWAPLNSTIFHSKKCENCKDADILYMGMLFDGVRGDECGLYQIPRYDSQGKEFKLYQNCVENFDNLFHRATRIFRWSREEGRIFFPDVYDSIFVPSVSDHPLDNQVDP